jgi:hypothetical protein
LQTLCVSCAWNWNLFDENERGSNPRQAQILFPQRNEIQARNSGVYLLVVACYVGHPWSTATACNAQYEFANKHDNYSLRQ